MAQVKFSENIGKLTLKPMQGERRNSADTVYWLSRSARSSKKYHPLRNTEFVIHPISANSYRIMINNDRFDEAYTFEDAEIILAKAFDHECIRTGIDSASPKLNTANEDAPPTRRRY